MDKKALIREYKETSRPMGVYCIRNTVNGKLLIGKSIDLPSILNRQRAQLRSGSHPNPTLQTDLYAAHTKKWILTRIARRAFHRSSRTRTSPES